MTVFWRWVSRAVADVHIRRHVPVRVVTVRRACVMLLRRQMLVRLRLVVMPMGVLHHNGWCVRVVVLCLMVHSVMRYMARLMMDDGGVVRYVVVRVVGMGVDFAEETKVSFDEAAGENDDLQTKLDEGLAW